MKLRPETFTKKDLAYLRVYYPAPVRKFVHIGPIDYIPDLKRSEVRLIWRRLYRKSRTMTSRAAHFKVSLALASLIHEFGGPVKVRFDCQDVGGMDPIVGCLSRALKQRDMVLSPAHLGDLLFDALVLLRRMTAEVRLRYTHLEDYLDGQVRDYFRE